METTQELVRRIHSEFNSASSKVLELGKNSKTKQFLDIGFINAKGCDESLLNLCSTINEYGMTYPKYKFISNADIMALCNKYHLVYAPIENYKGDVPQKNLNEITTFLKEMGDRTIITGIPTYSGRGNYRLSKKYEKWAEKQPRTVTFQELLEKWVSLGGAEQNIKAASTEELKARDCLYICAPRKDMILKGLVFNGLSYNLPDPVVICKVPKGGLIVTAWGDEASDETVFNELHN